MVYNNFKEVPVDPTWATPNMSVYIAEENGSKWVEVDGYHIRDQENEDYCDCDEVYDLREEADENLHSFVENVCNNYNLSFEKIEDYTDGSSYYYYIGDKSAFIGAARKYVAEKA